MNLELLYYVAITLAILGFDGLHCTKDGPVCEVIEDTERFDCFPEFGANANDCVARGCCWRQPQQKQSIGTKKRSKKNATFVSTPYCYYPHSFPNYEVVSQVGTSSGRVYSIEKQNATFRPNEILKLEVRVIYETSQRLRVQIIDPNNSRYEVPQVNSKQSHNKFKLDNNKEHQDTDYQFYVNESPFYIQVFRKSTGKLIFDTSVAPLIYADQYLEFSTSLVNGYFYGMGEHRDSLAHTTQWKTFTMWNRDQQPSLDTNLYGTHPFYMSIENDTNAFGFYLLNSNGMDINVQPTPALTFITIGGILDFYIYMGPTPSQVVQQHTEVVGRSQFPQYWTLGFHLCRWRYDSSAKMKQVIQRNRAAGIPYDTQWADIDHMDAKMDWTYDHVGFKDLPALVDDLHGQHFVNIIDPAISNTTGYWPYETGLAQNVFIRESEGGEPLVGVVWPGTTVFPDFTHPNATQWWAACAQRFHQLIAFDGIWIDMNEPSNFVDGSVNGCSASTYNTPPYTPKVLGQSLISATLCPSALQHLSNHYNLHNMYAHFEAMATYKALQATLQNKRPFVLTRSSFAGTGQFAAHWSGDNRANWQDLYYSIPNMLNFNMFGVSQVGSDVCGFAGNTSEELCVRWMQLGSFYPFMRNHNDDQSVDQDPAVFSLSAQEAIRKALHTRYMLLPYLYTLFYQSSTLGLTVVRPLFFEFVADKETHFIDRQFMFGPAFLITPVLEQAATSVRGYFPINETWYKLNSGAFVNNSVNDGYVDLKTPLNDINVHIRAGYIVPIQYPAVTTTKSRLNPFGLLVALRNTSSEAAGNLFWDDGESADSIDSKKYNFFHFQANNSNLDILRVQSNFDTRMILDEIKVFGVNVEPTSVTINDQQIDNFDYDDLNFVLKVKYLAIDLNGYDKLSFRWS